MKLIYFLPLFLLGILISTILVAKPLGTLPTPTKGLSMEGQQISYAALTKGTIFDTKTINGHIYTVRKIFNYVLLYNENGHIIIITEIGNKGTAILENKLIDPLKNIPTRQFTSKVDNTIYTTKLIIDEGTASIAVYVNNQYFFSIFDITSLILTNPKPVQNHAFDI